MSPDLESIFRLALSCLLGGIIGFERQANHKSAGLRTNVLVCLGSCLIMLLSQALYGSVAGQTNADPARLAAQVVSGIGFLGAGAIMKEGLNVIGLTTAACLWVVAGVGLAAGGGYYLWAIATTAMVYITLVVMSRLDRWLLKENYFTLVIDMVEHPGQVSRISSLLEVLHLKIRGIRMKTEPDARREKGAVTVELDLECQQTVDRATVIDTIRTLRGIVHVEVQG
ncbi:MAG: MgtC/SapB family protein [Schwartzia sp.]|nr:MgtC/SapB family protein [Schwartzia sp. (in: firmicutes)]